MRLADSVRHLARRLRRPRRPQRFQPAYEDRGAAQDERVQQFVARRTPSFLFDPATLASSGERPAELQCWYDTAGRETAAMLSIGLPVYGRLAPPLRPGFPWGGEWCADCRDVLFDVRPHRFAFAPRLALAVVADRHAPREFEKLLDDWMAFAQRAPRLPFISNLVATQRLVASTCALHFLVSKAQADSDVRALMAKLLLVMREDVAFLQPRLGQSYPNNHLLIDRFAGWFIAAILPELAERRFELTTNERAWLAELERQTYADGGSFEHAVHYHSLAAEAAAAYLLLKRANGEPVAPVSAQRIERLLRFQADLAGPDGHAPQVGDGTEDPLFPLDAGGGHGAGALREIHRRLFAPQRRPLNAGHPECERVFWLLQRQAPIAMLREQESGLAAYADSGFYVLREEGEETRCVFRTGPAPGKSTMAGHMHSDLLSVCLVSAGRPVLVDPGTYTYRYGVRQLDSAPGAPIRNWRAHFASAQAHNGFATAQDPLGEVKGDFRSAAARAAVRERVCQGGARLAWVHADVVEPAPFAGYGRGVVHVRGKYFVVYDLRPGSSERAGYPWQLAPDLRVSEQASGSIAIDDAGGEMVLLLAASSGLERVQHWPDSNAPVEGWISPAYGELLRAPQLMFQPTRERASAFLLAPGRTGPPASIEVDPIQDQALAIRVRGDGWSDLLILNLNRSAVIRVEDIELDGALLWLRLRTGESESGHARALGLRSVRIPQAGIDVRFGATQSEWYAPAVGDR